MPWIKVLAGSVNSGETNMNLPTSAAWAETCAGDGEFLLASRFWTGGLKLNIDDLELGLTMNDGQVSADAPAGSAGVIELSGSSEVWAKVLADVPPRFHNDVMANLSTGSGLSRSGDPVVIAQYYAAVARALELLRLKRAAGPELPEQKVSERFDAPVGRYVHIEIEGHDHRIYFEEAGQGIPLLMQHTAGCHGSQWRHLFEDPSITRHFRLIAYDLPYHGKSMPPSSRQWWSERYNLQGEFLRAVPIKLSAALELDRPVFMGCSVGGLLALDLAYRHADLFRAVISVEGALKIEGQLEALNELWHPQVSSEYKARAMEGLMSPTSPAAYRKETGFVYASGWPPAFLGDLFYYINDFDMRNTAAKINTGHVGVHILSGEYDWSGTAELGREAHEAIPGSTWAEMKGVGHFPMSENPEEFIEYLRPVLAAIRS
jgi:pimeloyl-ACP methyl ester carboxylesterase